MKKLAIMLLLGLCAVSAQAGTIYDIQIGGLYAPGDVVTAFGIVYAVADNGVWIIESPFGPGNGIWVYLDSGHPFVVGDMLEITADYTEYYDLSELDAAGYDDVSDTDWITWMGNMAVPAPLYLTAAEAMADPELYEGNYVFLTDGFQVIEMLTYGEWKALAIEDLTTVIWFDDVMYDESGLSPGVCFNHAIGAWTYSFGNYKMLPLADGIPIVGCTVKTKQATFGSIKGMYR
jgi:hypothetical protein